MKHEKVETAEAIDEMISMLLDSKRELALLQRKKKETTNILGKQFEQITVSIEEKRAEITKRVLNKTEKESVRKQLEEYRKKNRKRAPTEANIITANKQFYNSATTTNLPSTVTIEDKDGYSQLSVVTDRPIDDPPHQTNPAFTVADVHFNTDRSGMNEYTDISGEYNVGIDTAEADITYIAIDLQSSILQRMLNPSTKEIAKIESNKIQKVELIRWDVATKLQIYASGQNTDLIFKNI